MSMITQYNNQMMTKIKEGFNPSELFDYFKKHHPRAGEVDVYKKETPSVRNDQLASHLCALITIPEICFSDFKSAFLMPKSPNKLTKPAIRAMAVGRRDIFNFITSKHQDLLNSKELNSRIMAIFDSVCRGKYPIDSLRIMFEDYFCKSKLFSVKDNGKIDFKDYEGFYNEASFFAFESGLIDAIILCDKYTTLPSTRISDKARGQYKMLNLRDRPSGGLSPDTSIKFGNSVLSLTESLPDYVGDIIVYGYRLAMECGEINDPMNYLTTLQGKRKGQFLEAVALLSK